MKEQAHIDVTIWTMIPAHSTAEQINGWDIWSGRKPPVEDGGEVVKFGVHIGPKVGPANHAGVTPHRRVNAFADTVQTRTVQNPGGGVLKIRQVLGFVWLPGLDSNQRPSD